MPSAVNSHKTTPAVISGVVTQQISAVNNIACVFTSARAQLCENYSMSSETVENNVRWLRDAAQRFNELAHLLTSSDRARWILLTDMYRESADMAVNPRVTTYLKLGRGEGFSGL
jgi:hypothetical protein